MYGHEQPMNKERIFLMKEVVKELCGKVNRNYATTADLMKEVLTLVDYEPFPLSDHLVPDYPLPLPPPLPRFTSTAPSTGPIDAPRAENFTSSSPASPPPLPPPPPPPARLVWCDGTEERASDFEGRYMVASRDLHPGETVLVEKAFVTVVGDKQAKVFCEVCYAYPKPEQDFSKCSSCMSVVWCSNSCRETSLREFHGYECATKSQLALLKTDHYYLAMRMIIRGWDNAKQKFLTGASIGESLGMADEFSLVENKGKLGFEKTVEAAVMCKVFLWVLKSAGFTQRLHDQIKAEEIKPDNYTDEFLSLDHFIATTLLSHYIRIQCNAFQHNFLQVIQRNPYHPRTMQTIEPYKPLGFGVLVSLKIAQINHSCRPNCDYYFLGDLHVIRTIDYIKRGEEIFITYERMARSMTEKEDRSQHVAKNYGFACFCAHCNTPGMDLSELYAQEHSANAEEKSQIESKMEEANELVGHSKVEEALHLLFRLKQTCVERAMFWTASEIDERIDDCFGLLGTKIFVVY